MTEKITNVAHPLICTVMQIGNSHYIASLSGNHSEVIFLVILYNFFSDIEGSLQ